MSVTLVEVAERNYRNTPSLSLLIIIINKINPDKFSDLDLNPDPFQMHFTKNIKCISASAFPDPLKIAKVTLILKKDKKKNKTSSTNKLKSNYRPINILSNASKLNEIKIYDQL